jgi:hypothetical protein
MGSEWHWASLEQLGVAARARMRARVALGASPDTGLGCGACGACGAAVVVQAAQPASSNRINVRIRPSCAPSHPSVNRAFYALKKISWISKNSTGYAEIFQLMQTLFCRTHPFPDVRLYVRHRTKVIFIDILHANLLSSICSTASRASALPPTKKVST